MPYNVYECYFYYFENLVLLEIYHSFSQFFKAHLFVIFNFLKLLERKISHRITKRKLLDVLRIISDIFYLIFPYIYKSQNHHHFGISVRCFSRSVSGRLTGKDISGHYKRHSFLSFFSVVYFSHRRSALIKKLIRLDS